MCESVMIRHYNKEKTQEIMRFSWRLPDKCTKEHFIQSKIHKKNGSEPAHIRQCYGGNHWKNEKTTRKPHKVYKKRKLFCAV